MLPAPSEITSSMKMEAARSSETLVYKQKDTTTQKTTMFTHTEVEN
jgi:hypothetical protein